MDPDPESDPLARGTDPDPHQIVTNPPTLIKSLKDVFNVHLQQIATCKHLFPSIVSIFLCYVHSVGGIKMGKGCIHY